MFDLKSYLSRKKQIIDAALDAELPPSRTLPSVLHKAIRYSVFSGGKRIRPVLCMASAEAVGGKAAEALFPSLALELLHTYTLIHDDLPCMDDDDLRRGKPTCHVAFGEANALLAGDALQALAFGLLARARVPPPYPGNQFVAELAQAAGSCGVVGGQVEDLAAGGAKPTAAVMRRIHLRKTATLFRAAARMGAIAGHAGQKELEALTDYGTCVGLAFQITDDILDGNTSPGKARKLDKSSCLSVYGPQLARQKANGLTEKAVFSLKGLDSRRSEPLIVLAKFISARMY